MPLVMSAVCSAALHASVKANAEEVVARAPWSQGPRDLLQRPGTRALASLPRARGSAVSSEVKLSPIPNWSLVGLLLDTLSSSGVVPDDHSIYSAVLGELAGQLVGARNDPTWHYTSTTADYLPSALFRTLSSLLEREALNITSPADRTDESLYISATLETFRNYLENTYRIHRLPGVARAGDPGANTPQQAVTAEPGALRQESRSNASVGRPGDAEGTAASRPYFLARAQLAGEASQQEASAERRQETAADRLAREAPDQQPLQLLEGKDQQKKTPSAKKPLAASFEDAAPPFEEAADSAASVPAARPAAATPSLLPGENVGSSAVHRSPPEPSASTAVTPAISRPLVVQPGLPFSVTPDKDVVEPSTNSHAFGKQAQAHQLLSVSPESERPEQPRTVDGIPALLQESPPVREVTSREILKQSADLSKSTGGLATAGAEVRAREGKFPGQANPSAFEVADSAAATALVSSGHPGVEARQRAREVESTPKENSRTQSQSQGSSATSVASAALLLPVNNSARPPVQETQPVLAQVGPSATPLVSLSPQSGALATAASDPRPADAKEDPIPYHGVSENAQPFPSPSGSSAERLAQHAAPARSSVSTVSYNIPALRVLQSICKNSVATCKRDFANGVAELLEYGRNRSGTRDPTQRSPARVSVVSAAPNGRNTDISYSIEDDGDLESARLLHKLWEEVNHCVEDRSTPICRDTRAGQITASLGVRVTVVGMK